MAVDGGEMYQAWDTRYCCCARYLCVPVYIRYYGVLIIIHRPSYHHHIVLILPPPSINRFFGSTSREYNSSTYITHSRHTG